jgi:hypothetical protein
VHALALEIGEKLRRSCAGRRPGDGRHIERLTRSKRHRSIEPARDVVGVHGADRHRMFEADECVACDNGRSLDAAVHPRAGRPCPHEADGREGHGRSHGPNHELLPPVARAFAENRLPHDWTRNLRCRECHDDLLARHAIRCARRGGIGAQFLNSGAGHRQFGRIDHEVTLDHQLERLHERGQAPRAAASLDSTNANLPSVTRQLALM